MSEIFDFLKKTEAERRSKLPAPAVVPPHMPETVYAAAPEIAGEPANVDEHVPLEVEICKSDRFNLTGASQQIRSVLDPLSMVGEQFRLLRSRLGLMQKQRGIKTVLVTSTAPEEGKTLTASCLTGVFAQELGKRVILIDADMRKPRSGLVFGLNGSGNGGGLSALLQGNIQFQKALLTSLNPEFCFLPAGPLPPNPSELLSSPIMEETIKTAAESFDWVIVDSPPVLSLADTTLIAALCDTVVLVVRANVTPSKLVKDAVNRIGRDKICGVVINRQKQIHSSRYYYQYYYRGSNKDRK